jgi:hypothetical protein
MKRIHLPRRRFLAASAAATLLPASAAVAAQGAGTRPDAGSCGGLTREQFLEYVSLFNANDPRFIRYYHDDVVLELGAREIRGAAQIRDFYAGVKAHIREKVEVSHFVADATGIAAELPTEFRCYRDWNDSFWQRPLKAGEVLRIVSFGLYWVEDGRFRRIKSARYRQINDWQMEA